MSIQSIRQIQQALIAKGFSPGEVDGVWGRRSIAAIKAYQSSVGLKPDGIVGPKTSAALFSGTTFQPMTLTPPWLAEAHNLLGIKELPGRENSTIILNWADNLDLHYPSDDIPWCGLFVAHCVGATLTEEILPANPLGARQWLSFGDPTEPRLGALMVFWREARTSFKGHVGFYTGEDDKHYRILGGNQNDSVCITWINRERLLKARWPRTAASIAGGASIVFKSLHEEVSAREA